MKEFPVQTALTIVALGLLLMAAHRLQPSIWGPALADFAHLIDFGGGVEPAAVTAPTRHPAAPKAPHRVVLLDDSESVLDYFYAALSRRGANAVTRVVHYGDSPTTADLITGDVRSLLQKQFGNAGHGFILLEQPWAWYQHYGVKLLSFGWHPTPATLFRVQDGLFGLGGVTFTGMAPTRTHYSMESGRHSYLEVWFLRRPGGGLLSLSSGNRKLAEVDTATDETSSGFWSTVADPPVSEFDVTVERGEVRAFGVVAETGDRGVVYDSLGLNGGATSVLARIFNAAHWTEQLRHRNPDLVVINYGTNEADFGDFIEKEYKFELREAIRRVRVALPKASILIMSPMDRGHWAGPGLIETLPTIPRIVEIQSVIAHEMRCAFFNTFEAMGGEGSVARWYRMAPPLVAADLIHPHPAGAKTIASSLVKELLVGLARYQSHRETPQVGAAGAIQ